MSSSRNTSPRRGKHAHDGELLDQLVATVHDLDRERRDACDRLAQERKQVVRLIDRHGADQKELATLAQRLDSLSENYADELEGAEAEAELARSERDALHLETLDLRDDVAALTEALQEAEEQQQQRRRSHLHFADENVQDVDSNNGDADAEDGEQPANVLLVEAAAAAGGEGKMTELHPALGSLHDLTSRGASGSRPNPLHHQAGSIRSRRSSIGGLSSGGRAGSVRGTTSDEQLIEQLQRDVKVRDATIHSLSRGQSEQEKETTAASILYATLQVELEEARLLAERLQNELDEVREDDDKRIAAETFHLEMELRAALRELSGAKFANQRLQKELDRLKAVAMPKISGRLRGRDASTMASACVVSAEAQTTDELFDEFSSDEKGTGRRSSRNLSPLRGEKASAAAAASAVELQASVAAQQETITAAQKQLLEAIREREELACRVDKLRTAHNLDIKSLRDELATAAAANAALQAQLNTAVALRDSDAASIEAQLKDEMSTLKMKAQAASDEALMRKAAAERATTEANTSHRRIEVLGSEKAQSLEAVQRSERALSEVRAQLKAEQEASARHKRHIEDLQQSLQADRAKTARDDETRRKLEGELRSQIVTLSRSLRDVQERHQLENYNTNRNVVSFAVYEVEKNERKQLEAELEQTRRLLQVFVQESGILVHPASATPSSTAATGGKGGATIVDDDDDGGTTAATPNNKNHQNRQRGVSLVADSPPPSKAVRDELSTVKKFRAHVSGTTGGRGEEPSSLIMSTPTQQQPQPSGSSSSQQQQSQVGGCGGGGGATPSDMVKELIFSCRRRLAVGPRHVTAAAATLPDSKDARPSGGTIDHDGGGHDDRDGGDQSPIPMQRMSSVIDEDNDDESAPQQPSSAC